MKKIAYGIISLTCALLTACSSEKDPTKLFEEEQSGVCLVLNSFYYKIQIGDSHFYCNGVDQEGNLNDFTVDENEIKQKKMMATGTAFFIDDKGTLLTNRHVVSPIVPEDVMRNAARKFVQQIRAFLILTKERLAQQYQTLENSKANYIEYDYYGNVTWMNEEALSQIKEQEQDLSDRFDKANEVINTLDNISSSDIRITPVIEIGIAYNGSFVTNTDDFLKKNPCVVVKVSEVKDVDLATIQLKDKKTPEGKYIFKIKGYNEEHKGLLSIFQKNDDEKLTIGSNLLMIGYNAGLDLGNTKQGVQAQMTKGEVTQIPDGTRLLYSIPTLQGSSGSPVIDYNGYVRAVNFAKLRGTDTFNFGIPENKIRNFLNE